MISRPLRRVVLLWSLAAVARGAEPAIDFGRDIQPILAQRCYDCHGLESPRAGLHLTSRRQALAGGRSGLPALVPGSAEQSELYQRIRSPHADEAMPPKGDRVPEAEITLLRRWIDAGAEWPEGLRHWAYVAPVRPPVPPETRPGAGHVNPIDAFVSARRAAAGLPPAPDAGRAAWLRRVSFDLIGLPPTLAELDAFLADRAPDAYERVVDRLLASPHYGERWARPWLDLARYADSHGFQRDDLRESWPFRDWVVRAMNADLPFDQFTIQQIAGDLLPGADPQANPDPFIATGFHRAAPTNVEAGTDQEEGRINQVFDRVNTTGTVWLGSTLECAQCHDHKYDPFTQRDYYRFFAFFNQTEQETAFATAKATANLAFTGPFLPLPDAATEARRAAGEERLRQLDAEIAALAAPGRAEGPRSPEAAPAAPDSRLAALRKARLKASQELARIEGPRTLVMREVAEPRMTSVLKRGSFLDPGERVEPGTPEVLPALAPATGRPNRLDLARWLVARDNPLVARVTVNRWWQEFFGTGLVRTPEDFGIKGEPPTHPELLDWLAVEFMEGGWSMKRIHRLIALSATYRQSSRVTPELLARDAENRLLARGPRFRLEAEAVRDQALAVAGLLSPKLGGPPVRPYQPPGLWEAKVGGDRVTYEVSVGEDAHRRGLYTVWKRASPYPSFLNFDAATRAACTVRRSRSNTPLQALTLLNDPVYVEAAAALAARLVREPPAADVAARVRHGFRLCVSREPSPAEAAVLAALHARQLAAHGDEQVAWQAVASALLNLDETITKN